MLCDKCGNKIPRKIVIDGKERNLQRRKYCLECSPFNEHNTRKLNLLHRKGTGEYSSICKLCGKEIIRHKNGKGFQCWACLTRRARKRNTDKVYGLVGKACWICGYDSCIQAMDFHHVYPKDKKFSLTQNEMQYAWDRILSELRKCVLLCACCHREYHAGLISQQQMESIYSSKWLRICVTDQHKE